MFHKRNDAVENSDHLADSKCNKVAKESSNSSKLPSEELPESEATQKFSLGLKDFCTQSQDFSGDTCNQVPEANLPHNDEVASSVLIPQSNTEAETPAITNGETTQPPGIQIHGKISLINLICIKTVLCVCLVRAYFMELLPTTVVIYDT